MIRVTDLSRLTDGQLEQYGRLVGAVVSMEGEDCQPDPPPAAERPPYRRPWLGDVIIAAHETFSWLPDGLIVWLLDRECDRLERYLAASSPPPRAPESPKVKRVRELLRGGRHHAPILDPEPFRPHRPPPRGRALMPLLSPRTPPGEWRNRERPIPWPDFLGEVVVTYRPDRNAYELEARGKRILIKVGDIDRGIDHSQVAAFFGIAS